jgi:hypothetical protein
MSELIERYLHQVGRYLPEGERQDIQAELRSQIEDQLEDRFGGAPSQAEVASVLRQLGDPRQMATSYGRQQYLVGPNLYPVMRMVLRVGLPIVPGVVVLLNIVGSLIAGETGDWVGMLLESIFIAAQAAFYFAASVVLFFAIFERSGGEIEAKKQAEAFNPLELPPVDDPGTVDRVEASFGIAIGAFFTLALVYFLAVGGVTLRFNLSDSGAVTPVSSIWLLVLIGVSISLALLNLWALMRNRWTFGTLLAQTLIEIVGAVGMYFVVWVPLFTWLGSALPDLRDPLIFDRQPLIFAVVSIGIMLLGNGNKLLKLWRHRGESGQLTAPPDAQASGKQSAR